MKLKKLLTCFFYLCIRIKKRNLIFTLIPIVLAVSLIGCHTTERNSVVQTSSVEQEVIWEKGIVFGTVDGVDLKLDLVRPGNGNGPHPALIFIHGGGWSGGNRQEFSLKIKLAAERGYVAVTVDYRLTSIFVQDGPKANRFPVQIHDVKCAVRWLRANAEKYNIDPARIGAYGDSAGGHLALLLGLTDSSDGLEGNCGNLNLSSKVQAVVSRAGPTDLQLFFENIYAGRAAVTRLIGGSPEEMPEEYRAASPITYVSENDPPVLTIHGDQDGTVPPKNAELLDERMKEMGISHTLIMVEGARHDVSVDLFVDYPVWDFFDKHLKN